MSFHCLWPQSRLNSKPEVQYQTPPLLNSPTLPAPQWKQEGQRKDEWATHCCIHHRGAHVIFPFFFTPSFEPFNLQFKGKSFPIKFVCDILLCRCSALAQSISLQFPSPPPLPSCVIHVHACEKPWWAVCFLLSCYTHQCVWCPLELQRKTDDKRRKSEREKTLCSLCVLARSVPLSGSKGVFAD